MTSKQKKRSLNEDSDESNNESKFAKLSANFWIYLKSNSRNLAQIATKSPKSFEQIFLKLSKVKHWTI